MDMDHVGYAATQLIERLEALGQDTSEPMEGIEVTNQERVSSPMLIDEAPPKDLANCCTSHTPGLSYSASSPPPSLPSPESSFGHGRKEAFTFVRATEDSIPRVPYRRQQNALLQTGPSRLRASQRPDRFIYNRDSVAQPREAFMLATPPQYLTSDERRERKQSPAIDPFGRRSKTVIRNPEVSTITPTRSSMSPSLFMSSHVDPGYYPSDSPRDSAMNVGASTVTSAVDGVQSVSNGRGGRITHGTNAPLFRSDFLEDQNAVNDHLVLHGKRLGAAMEVDQANRVLCQTPLHSSSVVTSGANVWQDSEWKKPGFPSPLFQRPKSRKTIPLIPFRVLDAPALRDDYYCSLLAYSETAKCLAVGLGEQVYTWSESRGVKTPDSLIQRFAGHVTSLSFSSTEGGKAILAIGRADGRLTLWSPVDHLPRFEHEQPSPVSCVCFSPRTFLKRSTRNPELKVQVEYLLVGDEAGHTYLYAIEWPRDFEEDPYGWRGSMILLARLSLHTQQICGLAWSSDGLFFATGGNDNALFLLETRRVLSSEHVVSPSASARRDYTTSQDEVLLVTLGRESHHFVMNAAVKALAFCPWQPSLLAAGGGSNDRCIHFYHTISGAKLATIDCSAQVTSLVWSRTRREIAATFGFAQPDHPIRVAVFSWPACKTIVRIP